MAGKNIFIAAELDRIVIGEYVMRNGACILAMDITATKHVAE